MFSRARVLATAAIFSAVAIPVDAIAADAYILDPRHTQTIFMVNHLGYSTVTGNFQDIKGALMFDEQKPQDSSVEVTIATASINTGVEERDTDLRSEHFFNTSKFPTMTFKSRQVTKTGANTANVLGELTLLGQTKPVTLKVKFNRGAPDQMRENAKVVGFSASALIKRSDFGMKAYLPYLGDDVALTISAEAVKQSL